MRRIDIGGGITFQVNAGARVVSTIYPDGYTAHATRDDTPENRAEASEQGYTGADLVWRSREGRSHDR